MRTLYPCPLPLQRPTLTDGETRQCGRDAHPTARGQGVQCGDYGSRGLLWRDYRSLSPEAFPTLCET